MRFNFVACIVLSDKPLRQEPDLPSLLIDHVLPAAELRAAEVVAIADDERPRKAYVAVRLVHREGRLKTSDPSGALTNRGDY